MASMSEIPVKLKIEIEKPILVLFRQALDGTTTRDAVRMKAVPRTGDLVEHRQGVYEVKYVQWVVDPGSFEEDEEECDVMVVLKGDLDD